MCMWVGVMMGRSCGNGRINMPLKPHPSQKHVNASHDGAC
jgi:hypothetical protein